MRTLLLQKKALLFALLEDFLFLVFSLTTILSALEILLPGSISAKIPLALVFSVLVATLTVFFRVQKKEGFPLHQVTIPRFLRIATFLLLSLIILLMNSDFGITAAFFQLVCIGLIFYFFFRR